MYFSGEDGLQVIGLRKIRIAPQLFVLTAIFICTLIIFISSVGSVNPISRDESATITDGWTCSWVDSDEEIILSLPGRVPGGHAGRILHIANTLPERFFNSPSLMIRTSEQSVTVHLNGISIYEYIPGNPQRAPGSMYHFISLPNGYGGGRLDIYLSSPLDQFSGIVNAVRIGSITSHILYILQQGSVGLFLAVVAIMLGFIMLAFFVSMCASGSRHPNILYLALFVVLSGCWMSSESRALELFIRNPLLITCVAFMSQYLAPIPLLAFVISTYKPKHTSWLAVCLHIFAAHFLVSTTLYLLGIIEFYDTVIFFHSLLASCVVVFLYTAVTEMRRGKKSAKLFFLGCIVLSMSICADVARYYFRSLPWTVKPVIYKYGLLIFIITTTASLAHHIFLSHEEKISHDILMSLAFTDTLTGFKNRRSFDERITAINENIDSYSSVHLVILDINGLKKVNDTYGHREGDQLIIDGARLIKETLGQLGEMFRIGGDEFVVLVTNIEPYFIQVELDNLNKMIADFNQNASTFQISIAYGFASFNKDHDMDLNDVFERADKSMYICKENQKGLHQAIRQNKSY